MPGAPRPKGEGRKIAYSILGKPDNMRRKSKKKKEINKILLFQETTRVR